MILLFSKQTALSLSKKANKSEAKTGLLRSAFIMRRMNIRIAISLHESLWSVKLSEVKLIWDVEEEIGERKWEKSW